jgi:hypothetical protein
MDARALRELLLELKAHDFAQRNLLGLLHLFIGRRIRKSDGTTISEGLTWRDLAGWLKRIRWDKDAVRQLGMEPVSLPPRHRERYWYVAISRAKADSAEGIAAGEELAKQLRSLGYDVGPPPGQSAA